MLDVLSKKKAGRVYRVILGMADYSVSADFSTLEDAIDCMMAAEYRYYDVSCIDTVGRRVLFSNRNVEDYVALVLMFPCVPLSKLDQQELELYETVTKGRINNV